MPKKQYIKRFNEWIKLKKILHDRNRKTGFKEGEIWWCGCGENVGVEINGKNKLFSRPVLIFKKFNSVSFAAIPLTTKVKQGDWYEEFRFHNKSQYAALHQVRAMSAARLYDRIGQADDADMEKIRQGFHNLYCG